MTAHDHNPCYGGMFPDTLHPRQDRKVCGKALSYTLATAGGLYRAGRTVEVNPEGWEECLQCPEFDACYRLSLAKLTLQTAVSNL